MNKKDKQILKDWTQYSEPSTHFYNDEKMVAFAKYYTGLKRTKVKTMKKLKVENGFFEVWKPTCGLRWLETDLGKHKTLQQKWISNSGGEKWQEIEIVNN